MGVKTGVSRFVWPEQGSCLGQRVDVMFNDDERNIIGGKVVRDDARGVMIIKLDNGRYVLGTECQYRSQINDQVSNERNIQTLRLRGLLNFLEEPEEAVDVLCCGKDVVAEWADDQLEGRQVTLRWWIADREAPDEEIKREALEQAIGKAETDWSASYSEITGCLWTDQKFKVGGHDMIAILMSEIGKYLLLEIDVH